MKTLVFAAGGTGGHIIPALTTARSIKDKFPEINIVFVGAGGELENKLYANSGFEHFTIPTSAILGKKLFGLISLLKNSISNFRKLKKIYTEHNVCLVIGFGGYPSFFPVFSAFLFGVPRIVFEQNGIVGLANKLLALIASHVYSVPKARGFVLKSPKYILNPVRKEVKNVKKWKLPEANERLKILVIGGSQGAVSLNKSILNIKDFFKTNQIELSIQTGKLDYDRVKKECENYPNINVFEYIENMAQALEDATLVICRAGAGAVSEIAITRRPAIFVPLAISQGHQKYNALYLVERGASVMFEQDSKLSENLKVFLTASINDPQKLLAMNLAFEDIPELKNINDGADELTSLVKIFI